ncbi:MAG TPA: hypothetical protein VGZ03_09205 [Acidimicrobiales bacterium]|nr:hypothetical protein [Acidimicrobiales bacterium]
MGQFLRDVAAVLVAAGILAAVVAGALVFCALWLRRIWRRKRVELTLRLNELALAAVASGARWLWTRSLPDRRWRTLQRARRDLARSSARAEHAVRQVRDANASLGDLESLTRRLRHAALDVDRSLRIAQRSAGNELVDELLRHAHELTRAANGIQRAAAASLAGLHRESTDELVGHVRLEEQALLVGTAR